MNIEGGCFCGAIRYEFSGEKQLTANCHCSMCRRTSAAPFVTWVMVPTERFRFTKGSPKTLQSSSIGTRTFCGSCGTPLTCVISKRPNDVDITSGSLDDPNAFAPTVEVHEDTKLSWLGHTLP